VCQLLHKEERKMKKNRYLMLLAAFPLLASCSGKAKASEKPELKISYSSEVAVEVFKEKIEDAQKNLDWNKEDYQAVSYKTSYLSYEEEYSKTTQDGKVQNETTSIDGSRSEGGFDSKNRVSYVESSDYSKFDQVTLSNKYLNEGEGDSKTAIQEIYVSGNPAPRVAHLEIDSRTYALSSQDLNEMMIESFVGVVGGSDIFDILDDYEGKSDEEKAEYKFYVDGNVFTVVYAHENTEEEKTGDVVDDRYYDKYDNVYQVEISNSKFAQRYTKVEVSSEEGLSEDSDVGKGMKSETRNEYYFERIAEVGEFEHKLIDISSYDKIPA
jgi:hypothetical protein